MESVQRQFERTNNAMKKFSRPKMHIANLTHGIVNRKALTPALCELVEATLALQTTNTKILAAYLQRKPATIRTEFQRILTILGKYSSHSL
ncbi:hypothetical protein SAMN05216302_1001270 [Nitrosomonas aestuarii]|uniref:Uncharacterized protein n=1 Tax=Nitrosomonas aestuarii TaxID=52441 RepID=A0A1I3XFM1_9PROT|nr:hypothetical protein [Nitrosomonas aestuarii]SFK18354.1 hypothetical protein SAMN05216302_1001270 [Nitrosomonas aestuarii]